MGVRVSRGGRRYRRQLITAHPSLLNLMREYARLRSPFLPGPAAPKYDITLQHVAQRLHIDLTSNGMASKDIQILWKKAKELEGV